MHYSSCVWQIGPTQAQTTCMVRMVATRVCVFVYIAASLRSPRASCVVSVAGECPGSLLHLIRGVGCVGFNVFRMSPLWAAIVFRSADLMCHIGVDLMSLLFVAISWQRRRTVATYPEPFRSTAPPLVMASSTDVTSTDASALLQKVAASGCLHTKDARDAARACEVGKAVLRVAVAELVAAAQGAPILNSKSADGTPINVVVRYKSALPSGAKVKRYGRAGEEFLVKNQFLRVDLPGKTVTRVLLDEPPALSNGKSAAAIFQS